MWVGFIVGYIAFSLGMFLSFDSKIRGLHSVVKAQTRMLNGLGAQMAEFQNYMNEEKMKEESK